MADGWRKGSGRLSIATSRFKTTTDNTRTGHKHNIQNITHRIRRREGIVKFSESWVSLVCYDYDSHRAGERIYSLS
jgi:hypothetical protein